MLRLKIIFFCGSFQPKSRSRHKKFYVYVILFSFLFPFITCITYVIIFGSDKSSRNITKINIGQMTSYIHISMYIAN